MSMTIDEQLALLVRGTVDVISEEELAAHYALAHPPLVIPPLRAGRSSSSTEAWRHAHALPGGTKTLREKIGWISGADRNHLTTLNFFSRESSFKFLV